MTVVLCIRPEPGCSATAAVARELGFEVTCCPLSEIVPVRWELPQGSFDGVLVGSANAFRMGGALVDRLVDKPVYAVGEKTATAARERGFEIAAIGEGGLQSVLDDLAGKRLRLLRIAGEDHVDLAAPDGIEIVPVVAYRSEWIPVPRGVNEALDPGSIILLHSALSAEHFRSEVQRLGLDLATLRLAALGPRIAEAAGEGWASVHSSSEPSDAALLALARDLCHDSFPG